MVASIIDAGDSHSLSTLGGFSGESKQKSAAGTGVHPRAVDGVDRPGQEAWKSMSNALPSLARFALSSAARGTRLDPSCKPIAAAEAETSSTLVS